jgi:hypothetical protein
VWRTHLHLKGACVIRVAYAEPLDVQKLYFVVSFLASSCLFPGSVVCDDVGGMVCRWWIFFFSSSFLSPLLKITVWPSLLFVFQLHTLFFLFLIFILGPSVEILFFQFHPSIPICKKYVFQFNPHSFYYCFGTFC